MEPDVRDRSALLTVLTTEHFTLQGARSGTITESLGRSTIYLGSLSASLVALALVLQGGSATDDFRLFALVIFPALVFLGTVTFVRVLETGIEDAIYALLRPRRKRRCSRQSRQHGLVPVTVATVLQYRERHRSHQQHGGWRPRWDYA